jgi:ammonia channel protein AmtB
MTPGLRSSEFKTAVLVAGAAIVSAAANWVSNRYALGAGVLGGVSYIVSRGLAKYEQRNDQTPPPAA